MERVRVFWIYFIVTLFFLIIGLGSLFATSAPLWLILTWTLATLLLMVATYFTYLEFNQIWWLTVLFVFMLVVSHMWTFEVTDRQTDTLASLTLVLAGLVLTLNVTKYPVAFWCLVGYLLFWFALTVRSLIA